MKKRLFIVSLMLLLSVSLLSCGGGGGGVGGGAEVFQTVTLTAQSTVNLVDSDVATHSAGCGQDGDAVTVAPDDIDVVVTSAINPGLPASINGSDVRLEYVKVKYKPANATSPALPDQKYALSSIVSPDSDLTVPIRIASDAMKLSTTLSDLRCTNTTLSYFVTLEFKGTEIDTNKSATFDTNLTVNFADFADEVAPTPIK